MKIGFILLTITALGLGAGAFAPQMPLHHRLQHHETIKENALFNMVFNVTDIPGFINGTENSTWRPQGACYRKYEQAVFTISASGGKKLRRCVHLGLGDLAQYFAVNNIQNHRSDFKEQIQRCQSQQTGKYFGKQCQTKAIMQFANEVRPYLLNKSPRVRQCIERELFRIRAELSRVSNKLAMCLVFDKRPTRSTWRPWRPTGRPNDTTTSNVTWTTPVNPTGTTPSWNTTWLWNTTTPTLNVSTTLVPNTTWHWNTTTPAWNVSTTVTPNTTWHWNTTTTAWNVSTTVNATLTPSTSRPSRPWPTFPTRWTPSPNNTTTPAWNATTTLNPIGNTTWITPNSTDVWSTTLSPNTTWPWPTRTIPNITTTESPETTVGHFLQNIWNHLKDLF